MEKSLFFEDSKWEIWKTNAFFLMLSWKKFKKMIQKDGYLNYMSIITSLNIITEHCSSQQTGLLNKHCSSQLASRLRSPLQWRVKPCSHCTSWLCHTPSSSCMLQCHTSHDSSKVKSQTLLTLWFLIVPHILLLLYVAMSYIAWQLLLHGWVFGGIGFNKKTSPRFSAV